MDKKMKRKEKVMALLLGIVLPILIGIFILAPVFEGFSRSDGQLRITRAASLAVDSSDNWKTESEVTEKTPDVATVTPANTPTPTNTPSPTPLPTFTPTPVPTVAATSFERDTSTSFYWPDSDKRYYTEADLQGLTAIQIATIRNEIYAREGYIFKTQSWLDYFQQKEWYQPRIKSEDFTDADLNPYEFANVQMIVAYEKKYHLNGN